MNYKKKKSEIETKLEKGQKWINIMGTSIEKATADKKKKSNMKREKDGDKWIDVKDRQRKPSLCVAGAPCCW